MAIEIPLTQGLNALVDDEDAEIGRHKWHAHRGRKTFYAERKHRNYKGTRTLKMHRVVMERYLGRKLFDSEMVDHVNGNGLDNRRTNLRIASVSENLANSGVWKSSTSGYRGVSYHKRNKRWQAKILFNGVLIHCGWYSTPEEASRAYEAKAKEIFGEFYRPPERKKHGHGD